MLMTCHCGNIALDVGLPEQLTTCNCSVCSRYQALWGYYPQEQVRITTGPAGEQAYSWGDKNIAFVHCSACGCVTHYRNLNPACPPRVAVNFRMAAPEALQAIPVRHFNGREQL